jgi:Asp/Glu/hydantoin racemase
MAHDRNRPCVALLHTTPVSTGPVTAAFGEWFPEAELIHITDDSLLPEVRAQGVTPAIRRRLTHYAMAAEATGAGALLNCCSSISETAALLRQVVALPVVQIDEPMAEAAVKAGRRIGVFATLESTLAPSVALVERVAREMGREVEVRAHFCEGAFDRLQQGDPAGHDAILADCVGRAAGEIDVAVLAQASMARAEARLARELPIPVYGSLRLAVQRVRELLDIGRHPGEGRG